MKHFKAKLCPCGSNQPYIDCCQLVHADIKCASLPEQIIRARFAAMSMGNMDFFAESIVEEHRHLLDGDRVLKEIRRLEFHSVEIRKVERKGLLRRRATVYSRHARSKHGVIATHTERTYLRRESRAWRVENIEINPPADAVSKIGRNVSCPCGSGRKYKRCCGRHQRETNLLGTGRVLARQPTNQAPMFATG